MVTSWYVNVDINLALFWLMYYSGELLSLYQKLMRLFFEEVKGMGTEILCYLVLSVTLYQPTKVRKPAIRFGCLS